MQNLNPENETEPVQLTTATRSFAPDQSQDQQMWDRLARQSNRLRKQNQRLRALNHTLWTVLLVNLVLGWVAKKYLPFELNTTHLWLAICLASGVGFLTNLRLKRRLPLLVQSSDTRFVGVLLEAYQSNERGKTPGLAREALLSLLPTLRPEDSKHLESGSVAIILDLLALDGDEDEEVDVPLITAILCAIVKVGTEEMLSAVETLAEMDGAEEVDAVREAAKTALPQLKAKLEAERARQTLLRPFMGSVDTDRLLRPVHGAGIIDTDKLLRPVESNEGHPE